MTQREVRRGDERSGSTDASLLGCCHTFSLHLPEVKLSGDSVTTSAEGIYDGIVDRLCRPHLCPLHPVHGIEYDVVVTINPVRCLSDFAEGLAYKDSGLFFMF